MRRAISVTELLKTKHKVMEFEGEWLESFGQPELGKPWFIMAEVASGKTTFATQLCKYLTKFEKVAYNSIEEGISRSMKLTWQRCKMEDVANRIILLDMEPIEELRERLAKRRSPRIVVIDSIQHSQITKSQYIALKTDFPNHHFIWISHMKGRGPQGEVAKLIHQDASVKITVKGFVAFVNSRYGGSKPYTIWAEGANKFHGLNQQ